MSAPTASGIHQKPSIKFGTDGWRGVIADDFTFENVRFAAQGIANFLRRKPNPSVVIGYDCRFSADHFAEEVARVMAAAGVHTYLTHDPSPTQVSSWTILDKEADGAVVVTASHNPAEFCGIKYKPEYAGSASPEVVAELEKEIAAVIDSGSVELADLDEAKGSGLVEIVDPRPAYRAQVARMIDLDALKGAGLKVLHDAMYGSGAGYVVELLAGGETVAEQVRWERNPGFGGIHPEPIPENLGTTLDLMKSGAYDLCICTDGDADRVGIIDETGKFINQLEVYALLMDYLLGTRGERGPVVRSLTSTTMADRLAEIYGVECHEVQVGFKYVGPLMASTNAVMGGEESGGFGFRGHIPERDGILAGLYFADMIVGQQKPLSAILAALYEKVGPHAYKRRDIRVDRAGYDDLKTRTYERIAARPPTEIAGRKVERVRDDDGFKFYFGGGAWALARFSGTEPLIRVYSEAPTQAEVEELIQALVDLLEVEA